MNHWPDIFAKPEVERREEEIIEKLKIVRPVVETGCVGRMGWIASGTSQAPCFS